MPAPCLGARPPASTPGSGGRPQRGPGHAGRGRAARAPGLGPGTRHRRAPGRPAGPSGTRGSATRLGRSVAPRSSAGERAPAGRLRRGGVSRAQGPRRPARGVLAAWRALPPSLGLGPGPTRPARAPARFPRPCPGYRTGRRHGPYASLVGRQRLPGPSAAAGKPGQGPGARSKGGACFVAWRWA